MSLRLGVMVLYMMASFAYNGQLLQVFLFLGTFFLFMNSIGLTFQRHLEQDYQTLYMAYSIHHEAYPIVK